MNNYQLYRTNLLLGGQLKWDIILDSDGKSLYVSDFNLSPISNTCTYNKLHDSMRNNRHQDNIRLYYAVNKGNFYESFIDNNFSHNYPIVVDSKTDKPTLYSNTFDMGCVRAKSYQKYQKQFEFLCPLWLEKVDGPLKFKISVIDSINNQLLSSKTLFVKDITNKSIHNRFVSYLNDYLKYTNIHNGNDNVLNINFENNYASISGINAETGLLETRELHNVVENIISRERPMMEVDNLLINEFKRNNIICNQLFNFNFCFNIDDLLTGYISKLMDGANIIIAIDVYMGDTLLEKRDFYTEYEFIKRHVSSNHNIVESFNVFDYLHDNENLALIDKNKFCQSICHWSLCDNNEYIFNVYEGFAGVHIDKIKDGKDNRNAYYENNHQYKGTPNLLMKKYDPTQNTIGWINTIETNNWASFYNKYILNTDKYKSDGVLINGYKFINDLMYNYVCSHEDFPNGFYLLGIKVDAHMNININQTFKPYKISNDISMLIVNDFVMLITEDFDCLTFGLFSDIIHEHCKKNDNTSNKNTIEYELICDMCNMLDSVVHPKVVKFNKSLKYGIIDTEHTRIFDIKEKVFYKDDSPSDTNYVLRYDGKIKPTFISYCNTIYYKDCIDDSSIYKTTYSINNVLGEPLYPSINYCAIKKISDWTYFNVPSGVVTMTDNDGHQSNIPICGNTYEYKWFNNGKVITVSPVIKIVYDYDDGNSIINIDEFIDNMLVDKYHIKNSDTALLKYIKSLYDITIDWDNADASATNYVYNITLELK